MQGVAAPWIPAKPGDNESANVPPGALVDGLVDVDVLRSLLAVVRPIGGQTDPLGRGSTLFSDVPALIWEAYPHGLPQLCVFVFVVSDEIVEIKPTDVAQDLFGALVAPVGLHVPDDVAMWAGKTPVVAKGLE